MISTASAPHDWWPAMGVDDASRASPAATIQMVGFAD